MNNSFAISCLKSLSTLVAKQLKTINIRNGNFHAILFLNFLKYYCFKTLMQTTARVLKCILQS